MKYKVICEIGRGGFGVVEKVEDSNGELYARKKFEPATYNLPNSPLERQKVLDRLRKRFRREVRTQQELSGPEIMNVLDADLKSDAPWFIMPLAEKTYDTQIAEDKASGSINIEAVADIMNGLQYLHDMGYVHRDLNPKNILLHEGNWKLTDFGAVLPPSGQTVTLTEGTTIYTELYCSPEQHNEFHKVQSPSDVYSFGCILHDLVGKSQRTPYAKHTAEGKIGIIIEKCTDKNANRRPKISKLRELVLEALLEVGGHFRIDDPQSEEWMNKIDNIESWSEDEFEAFLRFFMSLDKDARTEGRESGYVATLSTPFLTHLTDDVLGIIASRQDGISEAIVEEYCDWVRNTSFGFGFSDSIGNRLSSMYNSGTNADKAISFAALVHLASSHSRWYVMRRALNKCGRDTPEELAKRLAIELRTEELVEDLKYCVNTIKWDKKLLSSEIAALL